MKLYLLQHVPFEGPAWITSWAQKHAIHLEVAKLYQNITLSSPNDFDGLIVMGGPMGANDEEKYPWIESEKELILKTIKAGKPVLGICLGAQLIAAALGARVYKNPIKEIGWFPVSQEKDGELSRFRDCLPQEFTAFHWHGDTFDLPKGATHLAKTPDCSQQAFSLNDHVLGFQFHMEMTRDSVASLIENCRDDLTPGPRVQSEEEILSRLGFLDEGYSILEKILNQLFNSKL